MINDTPKSLPAIPKDTLKTLLVRLGAGRISRRGLTPFLLLTPALALSGLVFVGPLIQSLISSLEDKTGVWSWQNYEYIGHSQGYLNDLGFTLLLGLGTVVTTTLLGLPLALVLRRPFRGRGTLWLLVLLPLVTPHIIAAYALRLALSASSPFLFWLPPNLNGNLALVNEWPGLLITLTWKFFPVMVLPLVAVLQGMPPSYEEAARDLGAGWWRRLYTIILPLLVPGWLAGATLVLVLATSQFTLTLIIYGGQKLTTIPLDVYFETFSSHNPNRAAALGLVLLVITLGPVTGAAWWLRRQTRRWDSAGPGWSGLGEAVGANDRASPPGRQGWRYPAALVALGGFVLGPVICLVLYSFSDQWLGGTPWPARFTGRWYEYFFRYENGLAALGQSLLVALGASGLVLVCAVPAAYSLARYRFWGRQALEGLLLAKTATPVIIIAVGTASLFYGWRLTDSYAGLVLAHGVGALPLALRSLTAAFERADRTQEEAARDLGAGAMRRFVTVVLPVARVGLMSSAALTFLFSMDEFTVTFLISGVKYTTLPLRLYSSLTQGYIEPAAAAAVILLGPSLLYLIVLVRLANTGRVAGDPGAG